jgi:3-phosphoshikimate 1-carboxyvinyltransferase
MNSTIIIHPGKLKGDITAPVSKSAMQRALVAALIHKGDTVINRPGRSNDDMAMLEMIQQLGATVTGKNDSFYISSKGIQPIAYEINGGESGLGVRMITPVAALSQQAIQINGKGSLLTRPFHFFDEVLPNVDVAVQSNNGLLPLTVKGPLHPKAITVDGSLSSQFLTGLLMAYGAARASNVTITVDQLASKPYIDLTLHIMRHFRMHTPRNENHERFVFDAPLQPEHTGVIDYTVEGDWSGGAFLLVAGAVAGPLTVKGLSMNSTQADKSIVEALMQAQAGIAVAPGGIQLHPAHLKAFEFDATDCPDLFPPLVALAAYCEGVTIIKGVNRLAHKESNRGLTLQEEFGKMGLTIELDGDVMRVHGGVPLRGATLHSHNDHRIAMACAVAGLRADGQVKIEAANAVKKSYPGFYKDLKQIGAKVEDGAFRFL